MLSPVIGCSFSFVRISGELVLEMNEQEEPPSRLNDV